jgi:hypothetical protein
VFAFDVNDAAMDVYEKQVEKILNMTNEEVIQYVYSDNRYYYAFAVSHETVIRDAINKFVSPANFSPTIPQLNTATVAPFAFARDK